jgi:hypothetical protein
MDQKKNFGQATIEYLLLFAFIAFVAMYLVKGLNAMFGRTVASLAVEMTEQLSTGVCANRCFYEEYKDNFKHQF